MINEKSVKIVDGSKFSERCRKPLYSTYNFSRIPDTIQSLFESQPLQSRLPEDTLLGSNENNEIVLLILLDGFGWVFFERYLEKVPLLRHFRDHGIVSKITSQFPSTTVCHIPTLHTGKPLAIHGMPEWFYFEPEADDIIIPFQFSKPQDRPDRSLKIDPQIIFEGSALYPSLKCKSVDSFVFMHKDYSHSPFSKQACQGATTVGFQSLKTGAQAVEALLSASKGRTYVCLYVDSFDLICHTKGPDSQDLEKSIANIAELLNDMVMKTLPSLNKKYSVIVTADHGQVAVSHARTYYLDQERPDLIDCLKRNGAGQILAPCGSPRDFMLHVKEEALEFVSNELSSALEGKAEVYKTDVLIDQGLFGEVSQDSRLRRRLGNLIILPDDNECVWWSSNGIFRNKFLGHHGGLSPQEVDIPFLFLTE